MNSTSSSQGFARILGVNYLAFVVHTVSYLILLPLLYRHAREEQIGIFLLMIAISNFSAVGMGWLSGEGLMRLSDAFVRKCRHDIGRRYLAVLVGFGAYGLLLSLFAVLTGLCVGAGMFWDLPEPLRGDLAEACYLFGFYIFVAYLHNADILALTAALRQDLSGWLRILSSIVCLSLIAITFPLVPTLSTLILCYLCSFALAFVIGQYLIRREQVIEYLSLSQLSFEELRALGSYSGRGYLMYGLVQQIAQYADMFIVGGLLGPAVVGWYVTVWKVVDVSVSVFSRFSDILIPYWMRWKALGEKSTEMLLALTVLKVTHVCGACAGMFYAIFGESLVNFWLGPSNLPPLPTGFALAGVALFLQTSIRVEVSRLYATGSTRFLSKCAIAELLLKCLVLVVFGGFREIDGYFGLIVLAYCSSTWLPLMLNLAFSTSFSIFWQLVSVSLLAGSLLFVFSEGCMLLGLSTWVHFLLVGAFLCFACFLTIQILTDGGRLISEVIYSNSKGDSNPSPKMSNS